ncbi:hypothetical protein QR680_011790 [Steinernema hermaphroditum]|uniref:Uncharacterized protein n=1 Tax=Steinernema hermaphroditum TaxID=289476 RepID=A0AA39I1J2_9BILA|nr:hypothetical protein QR680_011790 [Steinernema hermaphroditum]
MSTPLLFFFLFTVSIDGCARMRPTEKDVTKGVCDQNSDLCAESTTPMIAKPAVTTTTIVPTTLPITSSKSSLKTCSPEKTRGQDDYQVEFNGLEYRNHIIFELNEDGAGLKAVDFYCDVGQALCVCDSAMKCATEVITESAFDHNLKVMLNCPQPGQCTVDGKILKTSAKFKDIRYVSCNKCATEVKLDNSPPLKPCLQTAEELGKLDIASCTLRADVPHQMCEVDDDAEVVNRIVVDYTTPFYLFYPDTNRRRCRYANGVDLISYTKNDKGSLKTMAFHGQNCLKTADNEFYLHIEGLSGGCHLFANLQYPGAFFVSAKDPTKKYTYEPQEKAEKAGKSFNDPTVYLQNIVWVSSGACPPRTCDVSSV